MNISSIIRQAAIVLPLLLFGCATTPPPAITPPPATTASPQCPVPLACPACPICPAPKPEVPTAKVNILEAVSFNDVPGWRSDNLAAAWRAFRSSCQALRFRDAWRAACAEGAKLAAPDDNAVRRYFESNFLPYRIANPNGSITGLATGYYEPLLKGSRTRHPPYLYPLYSPPDDLLVIDLGVVSPDVRNLRLRGRLDGRRVIPYWSRAEIDRGLAGTSGKELLWVDDPIEAFFLEIQGSGRIQLDSGETVRMSYSDQNGHPYQSIGRWLIDQGEIKPNEASMQGIKAWARANPARLPELLSRNPSYVFFQEKPVGDPAAGPTGALGVPLTPGRSVAVDPKFVPLGAPVVVATTMPNSDVPLERLMMAQDTGGAIRGAVRADYFWGFGAEAGEPAGRMRQKLQMWVLLPKAYRVNTN